MSMSSKMYEMNIYFIKLLIEKGVFAPSLDELLHMSTPIFANKENQNLEQKIRIY